MAQPLSIENEQWTYFVTTRTANSRLWLIHNKPLELRILGALARYQSVHEVIIYAFILMGNHYHLIADFPKRNRALFMRDFNSAFARLVGRTVKIHGRRSVWARRYSHQVMERDEDIEHWFFYAALNPVKSGLMASVREYPLYNSFYDAVSGHARKYAWIDWSAYLQKKRYDPSVKPDDFRQEYTLRFSRLPGYEEMKDKDYESLMNQRLLDRQSEVVRQRRAEGKGFLGLDRYNAQIIGATPLHTKTSSRDAPRPLILSICSTTIEKFTALYFTILDRYHEASEMFRAGYFDVDFPDGTYPPPILKCV